MKTAENYPAIFHIPDLQLAKTYDSVQDFFSSSFHNISHQNQHLLTLFKCHLSASTPKFYYKRDYIKYYEC